MTDTKSINVNVGTSAITLSQIMSKFDAASGEQHLRFSKENGLHTHARFGPSSTDFLAFFGNKDALKERTQLRQDAVKEVRQAIENEYGKGVADAVFKEIGGDKPFADGITKSDIAVLKNTAERLQSLDVHQSKEYLGKSLIGTWTGFVGEKLGQDQGKFQSMEGKMAKAVVTAYDRCQKLNIPASPQILERAAKGAIIKQLVAEKFEEMKPGKGNDEGLPKTTFKELEMIGNLVDRFTMPGGDFSDEPLDKVFSFIMDAAASGDFKKIDSVPKDYDKNLLKTATREQKFERLEKFIDTMLHVGPEGGLGSPLSPGDSDAFMRGNTKDRNDPGFVEYMMVKAEVSDTLLPRFQNVAKSLARMESFEFRGDKIVKVKDLGTEPLRPKIPEPPKLPTVIDADTGNEVPKTIYDLDENELSQYNSAMKEYTKQLDEYPAMMNKYQEDYKEYMVKKGEKVLNAILTDDKAKTGPIQAIQNFDTLFKDLIGGGFDESSIGTFVNSLPPSYCQMFAVGHNRIDEKARFVHTEQELSSSTAEELDKSKKQDLKDKLNINFLTLRVLSTFPADLTSQPVTIDTPTGDETKTVAKQLIAFSTMLQSIGNDKNPLAKSEQNHPDVVKEMDNFLPTWKNAIEILTNKIVERGHMINGLEVD